MHFEAWCVGLQSGHDVGSQLDERKIRPCPHRWQMDRYRDGGMMQAGRLMRYAASLMGIQTAK